jgi:hypothetical protein
MSVVVMDGLKGARPASRPHSTWHKDLQLRKRISTFSFIPARKGSQSNQHLLLGIEQILLVAAVSGHRAARVRLK